MAKRTYALTAALAMGLGLLVPVGASAAPDEALVAWYKLDETAGSVAADSSGNGRDAAVEGAAAWNAGAGFTFSGGANSGGNAVKLPNDIIAGLDEITVSADVWVDPALTGNHFIYNLGNSATGSGTGTGYLFATAGYGSNPNFRGVISDRWWNNESGAQRTGALPKGVWKHVTLTLADRTMTLFEDGVQVAQTPNIDPARIPSNIGGGTTTRNYIGRSAYAADNAFKGVVRDFRIYDGALSATEVAEISGEAHQVTIDSDAAWVTTALGDTSAVVANLTLPATGPARSAITWASNKPEVVSNAGVVTRTTQSETVELTATLTAGTTTTTRVVTVVVPGTANPDQDAVDAVADDLVVHDVTDVRGNLTLPTEIGDGVAIAWASSAPATIAVDGVVTRPATGSAAATVELTATLTRGTGTATRTFTATVPALPVAEPYEAYAFSYFTGDSVPGEKIYFGASNGNDARNWVTLNGGQPVLTSTKGTTGLRDPFLIRSPEGDKVYMIATDLSIGNDPNWDASQRQGSQYLEIWESTDMVTWSEQRHVKVSPDNAGNTWAPEAYWDDTIGAYVVFWASKLYADDDPDHLGGQPNRMMYATTRDFHTFTPAQVWQDTGVSRIDSTVIKEGDTYYRFTKDEGRNLTGPNACLDIFEERSTSLRAVTTTTTTSAPADQWSLEDTCIGQQAGTGAVEGPTVFKANEGDVNGEGYYLFVDEFGGRKYIPLFSTELGDGADWTVPAQFSLPNPAPRHGTVLPITKAEQERMFSALLAEPTAALPSAVRTSVGTPAQLPARVAVTFADGTTQQLAVAWDVTDADYYETAGTVTFSGAVTGFDLTAQVTVTVSDVVEVNIAPEPTTTAVASYTESGYGVDRTRNRDRTDKGWSNWQGGTRPSPATLTYSFPEAPITGIGTWFHKDGSNTSWPETMTVEYRTPAGTWTRAPGFETDRTLVNPAVGAPVVEDHWDAVQATGIRLTLANTANRFLTVSEVEIYRADGEPPVTAPVLAELAAGGTPVPLVAGQVDYTVLVTGAAFPTVTATTTADGAGVVIDQATSAGGGVATVTVTGPTGLSTVYTVTFARTVGVTAALPASSVTGEEIAATVTTDPADAVVSYAWTRNGTPVDGASGATLVPDTAGTYRVTATAAVDGFTSGSATAQVTVTAAVPLVFTDVTPATAFHDEIWWLAELGVTRGWLLPDGTREFRPVTPVARDAMAAFLYRLAHLDGESAFTPPTVSPFTDVATDSEFYTEIAWLHAEKISTGWDNGDGTFSFRPLAPIARDAMAAFLYRYADVSGDEAPAVSAFVDVSTTNQFYREISWLASEGIATGWVDGNDGTAVFRPLNPVNRDAMAAFMYRLVNERS